MRFANTITIDRPPAAVFAYLADLENLPRWNYAISETRKITAGPVRVGSRYRQSRTIPVHSEESLEVIEFSPIAGSPSVARSAPFPRRSDTPSPQTETPPPSPTPSSSSRRSR
jgi:hypothetical protein